MDDDSIVRRVFISGLARSTTNQTVEEYCSERRFSIDGCLIYIFPNGKSKLCGYIQFRDKSDQQRFLDENEHIIDRKRIEVKPFEPQNLLSLSTKSIYDEENSIYIADIEPNTTVDQLKAYFHRYGSISHCTLFHRRMSFSSKNRTNYFAFLKFEQRASVADCLADSSHHFVNDHDVYIERIRARSNISDIQEYYQQSERLTDNDDESEISNNIENRLCKLEEQVKHLLREQGYDEEMNQTKELLKKKTFENLRLQNHAEKLQKELSSMYENLQNTTKKCEQLQQDYDTIFNERSRHYPKEKRLTNKNKTSTLVDGYQSWSTKYDQPGDLHVVR